MNLNDPRLWKIGAGAALYFLCGSRVCRLAGLGLAGWGAWEMITTPKAAHAAAAVPVALPGVAPAATGLVAVVPEWLSAFAVAGGPKRPAAAGQCVSWGKGQCKEWATADGGTTRVDPRNWS